MKIATSSLLAGCAMIATASAAYAQPTSQSPPAANTDVGAGEIVVTAQKRSESINKVGISVTAVTGDQLQARGLTSAADLVKAVPGFNYTPSAYATPVYTLRGIGFYETSLGATPTVSVYVDEVPLALPAMTLGATLDVERVEVLKGPQGTLFGNNATGGAINYIAAKPTDEFHAGATLDYGRFNHLDATAFLSGGLAENLKARVSARVESGDPWQQSYTRDDRIGRTRLFVGRILLDWTPDDRFSFRLNVNGWRDKSDNQAAQLVRVFNPAAKPAVLSYPLPPAGDIRAADWGAGTPS